MQISEGTLPGVYLVKLKRYEDSRGCFVKTYSRLLFDANGAAFDMYEEFYSFSHKNVVRGMHFQLPPHDHVKIVSCLAGAVLDVLVDLRRGPYQGKVADFLLSADEPSLLVIPKGIAHGFKALKDDSLMVYKTSTEHAPSHDSGIRWDSIDYDWGVDNPIISARDLSHPALADFSSPF
jgi:dTDP-4-dehydrorhamnose 3,5-epimerase/CDP-3, 6-dideoxy-D-glycero-D-glycero-4-hexulose-5-epimerase